MLGVVGKKDEIEFFFPKYLNLIFVCVCVKTIPRMSEKMKRTVALANPYPVITNKKKKVPKSNDFNQYTLNKIIMLLYHDQDIDIITVHHQLCADSHH